MLSFYSRILIAYDGSDLSKKALDIALEFAQKDTHVQVGVVSVSNAPSLASMGSYGIYSHEMIKESREGTRRMMDDIREKLDEMPNKTRVDVLEGSPGKMIVEFAKKNDFDLILMGSRGLSNLKEVFLGSVSHFVVQRAHCPVFVIK